MRINPSCERPVVIIGSGFAGLATAIILKKNGISFRIFESNPSPSHIGGTVTIFPNGLRILREIGVAKKVIEAGARIETAKFQNQRGHHLVWRSMGKASIYGEPTITIKRGILYQILLDEVQKNGIKIEFSKEFFAAYDHDNYAMISFKDGSKVEASLLIGADGANSTVRKLILGKDYKPRFVNLIYYGGFVNDEKYIQKLHLDKHTQYVYVGPSGFFGYSYITNEDYHKPELLWYCYLHQEIRPSRGELSRIELSEVKQKVLAHHRDWHHSIPELIEKTSTSCLASVSEIDPLPTWSKGRLLIIGDAAHAMNPISGQGASTALEDAFLLGKLLSENHPAKNILHEFEGIRRKRVNSIAKKASRSSKIGHCFVGPIFEFIRNTAFSLVTFLTPEMVLNKDFTYRIKK